jgi:hypothetical protein
MRLNDVRAESPPEIEADAGGDVAPQAARPVALDKDEMDLLARRLDETIQRSFEQPFSVAVMGQTGVGKSSLLNALFDAGLATDAVRPCTKAPEVVRRDTPTGQTVEFWDMPGLAESQTADRRYLDMYRSKLLDADLCVWAIHIDTRSVGLERALLGQVLDGLATAERRRLLSKFAFVLTKADLLDDPPWILGVGGRDAKFVPQHSQLLADKSRFFENEILAPLEEDFTAATHNDGPSRLSAPEISYDELETEVTWTGYMGPDRYEALVACWPDHADLLGRLRRACEFVPCSSRFRFNLQVVLGQMLGRLDDDAFLRFTKMLDIETIDRIGDVRAALQLRNIIVLDNRHGSRVFDVADMALRSRIQWLLHSLTGIS